MARTKEKIPGRAGGLAVKKKYGKDYYRKLQKLSTKVKKKKENYDYS